MLKDLFGKAPNHAVNPDEAVAVGVAIQGTRANPTLPGSLTTV